MYENILSEIHDKWFQNIAVSAATHIEIVARHLVPYRIVDLGCGSGVLLDNLKDNCSEIYGFDISKAMIDKCKKRMPQGFFECADILNINMPQANVITMVGEILSYATAKDNDSHAYICKLFERISDSLDANGIFIFDCLGNKHDYSGNFIHEHAEFAIFVKVRVDGDIISREIISFRRTRQNYKKSIELHHLRMFDEEYILALLKSFGFLVTKLEKYAQESILPGRIAFECRKVS